jgi:hypothetical protein
LIAQKGRSSLMEFGTEGLQDLVEPNSGDEWTERVILRMLLALNEVAGVAIWFLVLAFVGIPVEEIIVGGDEQVEPGIRRQEVAVKVTADFVEHAIAVETKKECSLRCLVVVSNLLWRNLSAWAWAEVDEAVNSVDNSNAKLATFQENSRKDSRKVITKCEEINGTCKALVVGANTNGLESFGIFV